MTQEREERGSERIRIKILLPMVALFLMSSAPLFSQDAEARPSMNLAMRLNGNDFEPMEIFSCKIIFDNTGSSAASTTWINVTLPNQVRYVSDDSGRERGLRKGEYNWTFMSVSKGEHSFEISLQLALDAQHGQLLMLHGHMDYLDRFDIRMPSSESSVTFRVQKPEWGPEEPNQYDMPTLIGVANDILKSDFNNSINGLQDRIGQGFGDETPPNDNDDDNVTKEPSERLPNAVDLNDSPPSDIEETPSNETQEEDPPRNQRQIPSFNPIDPSPARATLERPSIEDDNQLTDEYVQETEEREHPAHASPSVGSPRPSKVMSQIISNNNVYNAGDVLSFTIFLNNSGSSTSKQVLVEIEIPSSVRFLDDTSSLIGGRIVDDLTYLFTNVHPGNHEFMIFFSFEGGAGQSTEVEVWVHASYTDSEGDFVGESSHKASCSVIPQPEQFPIVHMGIAVLSAGLVSVAAFSKKLGAHSLLPFFVPLYSRLKRKEILNHEARDIIIGYIKENPGEHFNSLKSKLDFRNGTLAHHLHILERERVIKSVKYGKYRRFFPMGMMVSKKSYPTELEQQILGVVAARPGINQKSIAKKVGKSKSTVNYHINKLRESNKIRTQKNGLSLRHYIVEPEQ